MRKTMTSRLSLAAIVACGLTVTACGGSSSTAGAGATSAATSAAAGSSTTSGGSQAATSAAAGGSVVKLSMLTGFTGPDKPSYEALVKDFNASHPNIQVTMDVQPWDAIGQKLPQEWATGQGPDLATPSSDPDSIFQYIKTNSVAPLTSAVGTGDTQIQSAAFPKSVTDAFTVNGQLYAVPANLATLVLYYNKDMFTKAGIAAAPTTQADFVADAKALTLPAGSSKPTQYGLTLADHATIQMWPILQWMNGGDIVDAKGCSVLSQQKSVDALTAVGRPGDQGPHQPDRPDRCRRRHAVLRQEGGHGDQRTMGRRRLPGGGHQPRHRPGPGRARPVRSPSAPRCR